MKKQLFFFTGVVLLVLAIGLGWTAYQGQKKPPQPLQRQARVAMVFNGDKEDGGWNEAHYRGLEQIRQEMDLYVVYREQISDQDDSLVAVVDELAEKEKIEIVFATSHTYGAALKEAARRHPEIKFFHVAGEETASNVATYFGRIYQARYLTGIVAGLTTKTNQIGYVAAYPIPEVVRGINAFTLGVRSVNPDAVVHVRWSGSWNNIGKEISTTEKLLKDMPIDVLTQHQNTTHPMEVADRYGIKVIGYNTDRQADFPDIFLTAPVWNWAPFCKQRLNECFEGRFEGKAYFESMNGGMLGIAPLSPLVPPEAAAPIQAAEKRLRTQTWDVFYGPIYDQQGRLRVERGENISDHELLQHFDWFVQGVEGTL